MSAHRASGLLEALAARTEHETEGVCPWGLRRLRSPRLRTLFGNAVRPSASLKPYRRVLADYGSGAVVGSWSA
jgi:hypothetical protein